jgi:ribosomal 50S subunit-associated protein YjgA (DUF615 family)
MDFCKYHRSALTFRNIIVLLIKRNHKKVGSLPQLCTSITTKSTTNARQIEMILNLMREHDINPLKLFS